MWNTKDNESPRQYDTIIGRINNEKEDIYEYVIGSFEGLLREKFLIVDKDDNVHAVEEWRPLRESIQVNQVYDEYMEWVDEVSKECEWKTTFGPEEIVSKICSIIERRYT